MSNRSREKLDVISVMVVVGWVIIAATSIVGIVGLLSGVIGLRGSAVVFFGGVVGLVGLLGLLSLRRRSRGAPVPASRHAISPLASGSLRWVRGLLPGDEGAAWLAEVTSCLAETPHPGERRRYVRSYRRNVPRLIWTSWAEHLSASRQRELL